MTFIAAAIGGLAGAGAFGAGAAALVGSVGGGVALGGALGGLASNLSGGNNSGGVGGGGLNSQANVGQTAQSLFDAYQNNAGGMYNLTNQYSPAYQGLQNQNFNAANQNLTGQVFNNSAIMQQGQNANNLQQAQGQLNVLNQYGGAANQAYLNANPQLQQLQNQYTQMAQAGLNPVGQIQGAGQWGQSFAQNAGNAINGSMVNQYQVSPQMMVANPNNQTLNQLNQTAQQQLALGSSMSNQQASTVANQVLSNYNSMGRANDPTAIAGLATGLDTYGQQLLTQREQNAANAAGLTTNQQGLGLQAGIANLGASQQSQLANQSNSLASQQANLAGQLGSQGLQYEALYGSSQQGLQSSLANQQAQLANANYQNQLMQGASNLAYTTGQNPYNYLMGQSQGNAQALSSANLGLMNTSQGQNLYQMYNPMYQNFNSAYGANTTAAGNNAATNAGLLSGGMNLLTSPAGINGLSSLGNGLGNIFGSGGSNAATSNIGTYLGD